MTEKSFHQQEESYTELKRKMKEITDVKTCTIILCVRSNVFMFLL